MKHLIIGRNCHMDILLKSNENHYDNIDIKTFGKLMVHSDSSNSTTFIGENLNIRSGAKV